MRQGVAEKAAAALRCFDDAFGSFPGPEGLREDVEIPGFRLDFLGVAGNRLFNQGFLGTTEPAHELIEAVDNGFVHADGKDAVHGQTLPDNG